LKIEFTGRQTEVPAEIRRLAERKLLKLTRVLPGITSAHVTVAADKHRQIAEVSIRSKRLDLTAQQASSDLGASLSAVMERLTRQVQRHLGRLRERKREGRDRARVAGGSERRRGGGGDGQATVVKSRRAPVKPMTLEEAAQEVGSRGEGVVVFRDATTERMSVLFRRRDGRLGLIEPEA
jgi:putative sigma-54 modulation protein